MDTDLRRRGQTLAERMEREADARLEIERLGLTEDITRKPRRSARRTAAWRRSVKEATMRWRRAHPENVARWKRENRMRRRAWEAILKTGVRRGDLQPIMDELGLEAMRGHHRYSEYEALAGAFAELCARQGEACIACRKAYALERAVRCMDGSLWGMACEACAAFVHVDEWCEIDGNGENATAAKRGTWDFIG